MGLPDKLSDCLELAIRDLKACEEDDRYQPYMGVWHQPSAHIMLYSSGKQTNKDKCMVCLAGSVMAKTLEISPSMNMNPYMFGSHTKQRLLALDYLRIGGIRSALSNVGRSWDGKSTVYVTSYHDDKSKFYSAMEWVIALLREHGQ